MLQVLVAISHKFCCRKEVCGYAKVIQKREKIDKCPKIEKGEQKLHA
jgi:hypothetical protein